MPAAKDHVTRARQPAPRPNVLFRVAAGPRLGFGHLVRCSRLAAALESPFRVVLRGPAGARAVAVGLGATVEHVTPGGLRGAGCDLLVVDDPQESAVRPWLRAARRAGVLSASIHDLGLGAVGADVMVDGTIGAPHLPAPTGRWHAGPAFAILPETISDLRRRSRPRPDGPSRVLIALGGGPRPATLWRVAAAVRRATPDARIHVAPGLQPPSASWAARFRRLDVGLVAAGDFLERLAESDIAVLAGGVSLYEAAALGVPAVGVAVVPGQGPTVRAFGRAGWAVGGGSLGAADDRACRRVARLAAALLGDAGRRRSIAKATRAGVDGRGAARVATVLLRAWRQRRATPGAREGGRPRGVRERAVRS